MVDARKLYTPARAFHVIVIGAGRGGAPRDGRATAGLSTSSGCKETRLKSRVHPREIERHDRVFLTAQRFRMPGSFSPAHLPQPPKLRTNPLSSARVPRPTPRPYTWPSVCTASLSPPPRPSFLRARGDHDSRRTRRGGTLRGGWWRTKIVGKMIDAQSRCVMLEKRKRPLAHTDSEAARLEYFISGRYNH